MNLADTLVAQKNYCLYCDTSNLKVLKILKYLNHIESERECGHSRKLPLAETVQSNC